MGLTKSEQKKILKAARKISPITIVLLLAFFAFGLATGFLAMGQVCKNDTVEVLGQKAITYQVGTGTTTYTEEGIKAVAFGEDISASVEIESNLVGNNGVYEIDLTEEGEYYIKYTFNHLKFGTVVKYRTITVEAGA
ncbi:MAG: hypothetical protein IKY15_02215 [Clostridia bacterium]|nr:hypothetical protein [Clostridia bacterium]MBR5226545.1 hypothetical protein [Clostridia bacterium]